MKTETTYRTVEEGEPPSQNPGYSLLLAAVSDDLFGNRARRIPLGDETFLLGRGERDSVFRLRGEGEIRIKDAKMSSSHARITPKPEGILLSDLGSTNGSWKNGARVREALLRPGDVAELGRSFFVCAKNPEGLDENDAAPHTPQTIDPRFLAELIKARRVASSQVSVLLFGESGTGKEVLAREIHASSARKGRLIAVHCGAIPEALIEGQLFGYRRGSFTGALRDTEGLISAADGGTLFLDEIGEMPLSAQVRLLRVLQEREVLPLGETRPRKIDIRLVAATHRDLRGMAQTGAFRGDLYARLEGITLRLPPLRQRRGDLGLLLSTFLQRFAGESARDCAPTQSALRALFLYEWPFNVRELEKVIEAAVALTAKSRPIERRDLPEALHALTAPPETSQAPLSAETGPRAPLSPEEEELKARLIEALERHQYNVSAVAREWGKARMQIQRWMKRFGTRES